MPLIKRPRQHNEKHLDFIRSLPCLVCGDPTSTEAAHIRLGLISVGKRHTGVGEKPDDLWTLPLCGKHHREQHAIGEAIFWEKHLDCIRENPIQPLLIALALWAHTGQHEVGEQIVAGARS